MIAAELGIAAEDRGDFEVLLQGEREGLRGQAFHEHFHENEVLGGIDPLANHVAVLDRFGAYVVEKRFRARPVGGARSVVERDFDTSAGNTGDVGFGYVDNDDETPLKDMKNNYQLVRVRKTFEISEDDIEADGLGLAIRFDDAFIAYLNGKAFHLLVIGRDYFYPVKIKE